MSNTNSAHRYTRKRAELALDGYREHGSNWKAAAAAGVAEATLRLWRKKYPDFAAAVDEAIDECAIRQGQLAVSAIDKHLKDYVHGAAGEEVEETVVTDKDGNTTTSTKTVRRPAALNASVLSRALTRMDPRYTHPKQEVEHSGKLTTEQSVAAAQAALERLDAEAE